MNPRIYAMDTHFTRQPRAYALAEQVDMVRSAGYDDYYFTAFQSDVAAMRSTRAAALAAGLGFSGTYVVADIAYPVGSPAFASIEALARAAEPPAHFELAVKHGAALYGPNRRDPQHDEAALRWIEALLRATEDSGIEIVLYPHFGFWMETLDVAVRLAKRLDHPRVGVVFCGLHWYAVDGSDVRAGLHQASPWLRRANLCGSRREPPGAPLPVTIEPLDAGELDNADLVRALRETGFAGPLGVQGYAIDTEAGEALRRSRVALRQFLTPR